MKLSLWNWIKRHVSFKYRLAALLLALAALPLMAALNSDNNYYTGENVFDSIKANFRAGLKVRPLNSDLFVVDASGNLDAATVDSAGAITGTTATFSGALKSATNVIDYITTSAARTITAAETGSTFTMSSTSDDPCTFTLPAAAAGLKYTFIDLDATAAADMCIDTQTGDQISTMTAGVSFNSTGDYVGNVLVLEAVNATNWVVETRTGPNAANWTIGTP